MGAVEARPVTEERVVAEQSPAPAQATPAPGDFSYPQRLESDKPEEGLERSKAASPAPAPTSTPTPAARAASSGALPPVPTPRPAATPTPRPAATPTPAAAQAQPPAPAPAPATPRPAAATGTLPKPQPQTAAGFAIQVGAFKDRASADTVVKSLKTRGFPAYTVAPAPRGRRALHRARRHLPRSRRRRDGPGPPATTTSSSRTSSSSSVTAAASPRAEGADPPGPGSARAAAGLGPQGVAARRGHARDARAAARGVAQHRVRGGALPEPRRVLQPRHGHLHAARRPLHAPLRLLLGGDGEAAARPTPASPSAWRDAAARLGLRYVVLTSVNRDDLADGGAAHFAATIAAVRARAAAAGIEVLTPDFKGDRGALASVLAAEPTRLQPQHRDGAAPLPAAAAAGALRPAASTCSRAARAMQPGVPTKSGLMLGLGETDDEMLAVLARPARERRRHRDARPVPAADAGARARPPLPPARGVRPARARGACARLCDRVRGRLRALVVQRLRGVPLGERALSDGLRREGLAALSGVLLVLSFPKFGHPAVAWIALVPLLIALHGADGLAGGAPRLPDRRRRRRSACSTGRHSSSFSTAACRAWPCVAITLALCLAFALFPLLFGWATGRLVARFGSLGASRHAVPAGWRPSSCARTRSSSFPGACWATASTRSCR